MTDYFALLDQPRQPWLDPEALRNAFHAKSLRAHPDAHANTQSPEPETAFAMLNEAYQVLQDPKRRIHHLLSLEGNTPESRDSFVPKEIEELFATVAGVTQQAEALAQKSANATGPLSRSLLKAEVLDVQKRVAETLQRLDELHDASIAELRRLSTSHRVGEGDQRELYRLYLRFSYLTRWMAELQEKQLSLL